MKKDNNDGCNRCGKCCCENYLIDRPSLNSIDIWRIKRLTGKNREEFTEKQHHRRSGMVYTSLKHVDDEHGRHCLFLSFNGNGTTVCEIYEARPRHCRIYPHEVECVLENRKIYRNEVTRVIKHIFTL